MKSGLLVLASLFALASCGGGGGGGMKSTKWKASDKLSADSPSVAADTNFSEGMGLLLIKKHGDLGVCTSFMVSPTHLMTNSHCLKDVSLTESCSDNVVVHLKTAWNGLEFKRCKKIVSKSKISGNFSDPDFAVIELDSPFSGTPKTLSREGIVEQIDLTVESVDYSQRGASTIYGARKISKCAPHMNSAVGNYTNALSSIIPVFGDTYSKCEIIPGNSGSPVMNANKKVVSVMFATLDRVELRRQVNIRNPRNTALATNLACIRTKLPWFDQLRPAECDASIREEATYMDRLEARVETGKVESRRKKAEAVRSELPTTFEFDVEEKRESKEGEKEKYSYSFRPKCMKAPASWAADESYRIRTENGKRRYANTVGIYSLGVDLMFDEYLRPEVNAVMTKSSYYELIVEDIDSSANVKVTIARGALGGPVTRTDQVLPLCKKL